MKNVFGSFLFPSYEEDLWKFYDFIGDIWRRLMEVFYFRHMKKIDGSFLFPSYEEDLWKFYDFIGDIWRRLMKVFYFRHMKKIDGDWAELGGLIASSVDCGTTDE
jgi:hypothetical protein